MKDNKIDNLFKDSLRDMEKSPGPIAWDKISAGLKKEKSTAKIIWWQKAAIIVIICLSGFLIFYKMDGFKSSQTKTVSKVENHEKDNLNKEAKESLMPDELSSSARELADAKTKTPKEENIAPVAPKENQHLVKAENRKAEKPEIKMYAINNNFPYTDREMDDQQTKDYEEAVATNISEIQETDKPEKSTPSITIEFKSGKKSRQKTLLANNKDIESNEDQSFTLKKLIAKVKEVKEGELGLAELRQAKDDLFAFDTFKEINKSSEK